MLYASSEDRNMVGLVACPSPRAGSAAEVSLTIQILELISWETFQESSPLCNSVACFHFLSLMLQKENGINVSYMHVCVCVYMYIF